MNDRTWMKVSSSTYTFWVGIEADTIVAAVDEDNTQLGIVVGLRADDTLSQWAQNGMEIEGPYGSPE